MVVKGLFRPHHMGWADHQQIEFQATEYLRNIIRIITETGLRVYKELMAVKKDRVNLENAGVWIPGSKAANEVAEVPLTFLALIQSLVDAELRTLEILDAQHQHFGWPQATNGENPLGHVLSRRCVAEQSTEFI